ncbi:MAG: hypothetical protein JWM33_403 [Caulobacteraceae bacterium]|nr:hypothetical protein [Caulobacteraceae bacterium]
MTHESFTVFLALATGAGAALASAAQPACHWSSLGAIALKTRLAMLKAVAPDKRRARLAALGLAGLIGACGLAAYAAEPSAPQRLATQAAGVLGSGDQLALRLVENGQERTLKPGDDYADGWKLDALTATSATLTKDGQRQEVGLNPTGALAQTASAAPPSQVDIVLGPADLALIDAALARGDWDNQPFAGRTLEQTRRSVVYTEKLRAASLAKQAATGNGGIDSSQMRAILGEAAFADMLSLAALAPSPRQAAIDSGDVNQVRVLDGLPAIGPDQIYIPAGTTREDAAKAAGLVSLVGYTYGDLDAVGGRTVTRVPGPPPIAGD